MLAMFLLTAVLVAACVYAVWPSSGGSPGAAGKPGRSETDKTAKTPATLEGVLALQLIDHEITGRQYARALEQLAARDDDRHPLAVPPEWRQST